jgi:hypothetical protein
MWINLPEVVLGRRRRGGGACKKENVEEGGITVWEGGGKSLKISSFALFVGSHVHESGAIHINPYIGDVCRR